MPASHHQEMAERAEEDHAEEKHAAGRHAQHSDSPESRYGHQATKQHEQHVSAIQA